MRLSLAFVAMILAALPAPAQRDSLLRIAQTAAADTNRIWALMEVGKLYLQSQPDSAVYFISQGLEAAEKAGFERGIAKCRINRAYAFNNLGQYRNSVADCQAAVPICERLGMKKELVAAYNNLGNAWDFLGNRWQAIDAFSGALQGMENADLPPHFPIIVRSNLARQYANLGLHQKSYEYGQQSYAEAMNLGDSALVASALHTMAGAALALGREDEALAHCLRVERISRDVDDPVLLVFALNNISVITWPENALQSEKIIKEALEVADEAGDLFGKIGALQVMARFAIWERRLKDAEQHAQAALEAAQAGGLDDEIATCYSLLSDIALATGDTKQYREWRRLFNFMTDTLGYNQLVLATQELETKYETAQKEQHIITQQLRIRQKNGLIGALAAGAFLLLLLAVLAWALLRNRRKIHRQETQIQQQKIKELEQERQLGYAGAVMQGQENERSRLARDLHDGLGGMLSGIRQTLLAVKGDQNLQTPALGQAIGDLDRSITELRHIARNMMPEALVRFGLKDALEDYCDHMRQGDKLQIHFQAFGMNERLPQETEVVLFRIAQELLNNVVRHAGASSVLVQLLRDGPRLSLTVEDDGKGFDTRNLEAVQGVGWVNIRSRVNYLGGILDVRSAPGEGCSVHIQIEMP